MRIHPALRFLMASVIGVVFTLALIQSLSVATSRVQAETPSAIGSVLRYVSPNGSDAANDCASSSTPCRTVQHAVDVSQTGDEIRVAAGTYTGTMALSSGLSATVIISKNLAALLGGYALDFGTRSPDTYVTILSASAYPSGFGLFISDSNTLVDGFSVTGGQSSDLYFGSGVRIRGGSPTISHNNIYGNYTSSRGAAIFVGAGASPIIAANLIFSNTAEDSGGGVFISSGSGAAVITGNTIISNVARISGGGVLVNDSPVSVVSNTVAFNRVISPTLGRGGGVLTNGSFVVTISHNEVYSNSSTGGSGLDILSPAIVDGNYVHHNTSTVFGAGVVVADSTQPVTLTNNLIVTNTFSGIWTTNFADIRLINNTIAQNQYTGVEVYIIPTTPISPSVMYLFNNIIINNRPCGISAPDHGRGGITFVIDYNDVFQNQQNYCGLASPPSGSNNLNIDPLFVNPSAGDYHIRFGSPAMDTGTNVGAPPYDKDGVLRPQGTRIDMGAYEVVILRLFLPLTQK